MSDRLDGWFAVDRKSVSHPFFKRSERSEYEAWIWIIAHAAWKETHHYVNGKRHDVNRGELFTTLRKLQAEWMWSSDKKVRGFLKRLTDERMIDAETSAGKTQITICNYSLYQDVGRKKDAEMSEKSPVKGRAKDALKEQTKQTKQYNSSLHSEFSPNPIHPKPLKKPSIKKSAIPDNWEPDQGCIDKAYAVGMDRNTLQVEAENFRNHHFNKQSKMVNWGMAFGTWCNNWKKFNANSKPSNVTGFPQSGNPRRRSDVEIMIERGNALRERGL